MTQDTKYDTPPHTHECGDCACSQPISLETTQRVERPVWPVRDIARLVIASLLTAVCVFVEMPELIALAGFIAAYLLAGYRILWRTATNLARGKIFDENFLMTVASLGAFLIGEYAEGVAVLIFFSVGMVLQNNAIARAKRSIAALMDIRPDRATIRTADGWQSVDPADVPIGSIVQVKPGERIPLDGVVTSGTSYLDTRALTGEGVPRTCTPGIEVLSGFVNLESTIEIETTAAFADSAASRILDLVEHAQEKKATTEQFITRFARVYTPIVLVIAALVAVVPPLLGFHTFEYWIYNALVFLVISCPCALVISIPLSFFGGIGGASKHGILVKGGNYLEALARIEAMAFDKTGTITQGNFAVTSFESVEAAEATSATPIAPTELLALAASAESHSSHPIATSLVVYARTEGATLSEPQDVTERIGGGVQATVDGRRIAVGSAAFLQDIGTTGVPATMPSTVYLAVDGVYAGRFVIEDEVRPDAANTLAELRTLGVHDIYMLTGDEVEITEAIAERVGIDHARGGLLPEDKLTQLEDIMASVQKPATVAAIGDGINDAPVLSRADVGIAMGGIGSDATIQAADIVIMNDDLAKLPLAIRIARKTLGIARQNIVLSLGIKFAIMGLALFGIAHIWLAIFADVGVALIALANAMRAQRA
ncbi:MAG: cadmium-translocating P-type ATPase [Coriobacteriia bacterium]|nr:cadmium-translocating P-type ATPase [Coriobacteriia bacterium]